MRLSRSSKSLLDALHECIVREAEEALHWAERALEEDYNMREACQVAEVKREAEQGVGETRWSWSKLVWWCWIMLWRGV